MHLLCFGRLIGEAFTPIQRGIAIAFGPAIASCNLSPEPGDDYAGHRGKYE